MTESTSPPTVIPIVDAARVNRRVRATPKGRRVDAPALAEVRALLGDDPRRRDLLIEYLHRIQDAHGHISAAHAIALAAELKLAIAEVYEVATFYHHFDVVKEGDPAPPELAVRVCRSLSCDMAGAKELLEEMSAAARKDARVVAAPCVGRCHAAPVVLVGQNPLDKASTSTVATALDHKTVKPPIPEYVTYEQYLAAGGYKTLLECANGGLDAETVIKTLELHRSASTFGAAGAPDGGLGIGSDTVGAFSVMGMLNQKRAPPCGRLAAPICPPCYRPSTSRSPASSAHISCASSSRST